MTEPSASLGSLNRFTQNDFTGGQNEEVADTLLAVSESPRAHNLRLDKQGVLRPVEGKKKVFANDFSSTGVLGLHGYYKSDGTRKLIFAVDDKILESSLKTDIDYDTQAEFETGSSGEFTSTSISPGYLVINVPSGSVDFDVDYDYTAQADFDLGTLERVASDVSPGYVVLSSSNVDIAYLENTSSELNTGTLENLTATANASLALDTGSDTWNDYYGKEWGDM